ncbi:MAG TPA: HEAT repeat domain-containing protein, partial [Armatimonadota bacterium]|nr:HEAT repeat domain-containing protein [Armatimonadota bacterium]
KFGFRRGEITVRLITFAVIACLAVACAVGCANREGKSEAKLSAQASVSKDVERLIDQLSSKDAAERGRAAFNLAKLGFEAKPAVPDLIAMLDDDAKLTSFDIHQDRSISSTYQTTPAEQAMYALIQIGEPAVEELFSIYRTSEPAVKTRTTDALKHIISRRPLEKIQKDLKSSDPAVRTIAVLALGVGIDPRVALLQDSLRDTDPEVRRSAVESLRWIGGPNTDPWEISKILQDTYSDKDPKVREEVVRSIGYIAENGSQVSVEGWIFDALHDDDPNVRREAVYWLGWHKRFNAVMPLIRRLEDESPTVRSKAAWSLWQITGHNYGQDKAKWEKWWNQNN